MAIKTLSTVDLRRELARRESGAAKLVRQRDELTKQLAALSRELDDLGAMPIARRGPGRPKGGGSPPPKAKVGRPRGRAKNEMNLAEALASAVKDGATVSPADAAKLVRANGYKSASKTFGIQVATTLAKHKRFKKTGRGQYQRVG
jgi:hypothetical protein